MTPDHSPAPKPRGWLRALLVLFIAFDAAVLLQWECGAFQSELGSHRDEAVHFLAGVRIREKITGSEKRAGAVAEDGSREELAASARAPVFPLALGGWMAAFGGTRTAALLFMAALAGVTAMIIFCTVRGALGEVAAGAAALLWLCAPATRESFSAILPEQLYALAASLLLWAQTLGARGEPGPQAARAHRIVNIASLLVIAGVVALAGGIAFSLLPGDASTASLFLKDCAAVPGIAVAAFALAGIAIRTSPDARPSTVWPAAAALVAGVLVARWLKSHDTDTRVLVVALPALAVLAVRGAFALAASIGDRAAIAAERPRRQRLWLALLVMLAFTADFITRRQKDWQGFRAVARTLVEESAPGTRVLVVSDAIGEGMLLSELAVLDREGNVLVERGSRTLALPPDDTTHGRPAQRFIEDEQLLAHLHSGRIRYIVIDTAVPQDIRGSYHDQARRVIEDNIRSFWPLYDSPLTRNGEPMGHPLRIFRVATQGEMPELR